MRDARPIDVLIVADDLTGACDAAVPFAAAGRPTAVWIDGALPECEVLSITTETRDLPPSAIPAAIVAAARSAPSAAIVYKKIDSTLRGHTAIEIAAALDAFGCDAAVVCPAFPANHRVVRNGYLFISNDADFAPIHVPGHLACEHVDLADLERAIAAGARVVSVDAGCDDDLAAVALAIRSLPFKILSAGSAGLAGRIGLLPVQQSSRIRAQRKPKRPLFALGSDHPVALEQQRALRAHRPDLQVLQLPYGRIAPAEAVRLIAGAEPQALVLSGGATASLVCRALSVQSIDLHEELIPGIPLGTLRGGVCDGLPVVTKSGGFGPCDALIQIADYFYGRGSHPSNPH